MNQSKKRLDDVFTELVTENQARIYGYVYALVHNTADTEDIVQRTLISLWKRFDDFEQGTNFSAWAITTARYEVLDFQKASGRRRVFTEELLSRLADHATTVADESAEKREALHACVEELPPADQQLLDRRYLEEHRLKDMATSLNRSEQSLSNSLKRIRRVLFDCVRRRLAQEARQ